MKDLANYLHRSVRAALVLALVFGGQFELATAGNKLTVQGTKFLLNGQPFDMVGLRAANALHSDVQTDNLIANLDRYLDHGVNALSVFIQGAHGGRNEDAGLNGFTASGQVKEDVRTRLLRLLQAADDRGVVVNVGYFYQRKDQELDSEEAVRNATLNATRFLRESGFKNIFLDVVNEFGHKGFNHEVLRDDNRAHELITIVRDEWAQVPVGISHSGEVQFAPRGATVAFLHGASQKPLRGDIPLVNNEPFRQDAYDNPGVYEPGQIQLYRYCVRYQRETGGYVFFHSAYKQGIPGSFEIGGVGTQDDPGDKWFFDYIAVLKGLKPASILRYGSEIVDDPLTTGQTSGSQVGGAWASQGWSPGTETDYILYEVPTLRSGRVEFDVTGLHLGQPPAGLNFKDQLFTMYDAGHRLTEPLVQEPEYDDNNYKVYVRINGIDHLKVDYRGKVKLTWVVDPSGAPGYGEHKHPVVQEVTNTNRVINWDPSHTYHVILEWRDRQAVLSIDDEPLIIIDYPNDYTPEKLHMRLGSSPRKDSPTDAVYSNLLVLDLSGTAEPRDTQPPAPPTGLIVQP